ncbi:hypothetical protein DL98DRAFT_90036 [Cadophora sp. DSE1049]|nr:hypothetical protein DL98DRAFT_90036 [Cadophora sp. DSE1049]
MQRGNATYTSRHPTPLATTRSSPKNSQAGITHTTPQTRSSTSFSFHFLSCPIFSISISTVIFLLSPSTSPCLVFISSSHHHHSSPTSTSKAQTNAEAAFRNPPTPHSPSRERESKKKHYKSGYIHRDEKGLRGDVRDIIQRKMTARLSAGGLVGRRVSSRNGMRWESFVCRRNSLGHHVSGFRRFENRDMGKLVVSISKETRTRARDSRM